MTMSDLQQCHMDEVVDGPGPGVVFRLATRAWVRPCPEPVAGNAHDGRPYCAWHLELMDEGPLMWFTVTPNGIEGPFEEPEP
jgi:hypothetical protein